MAYSWTTCPIDIKHFVYTLLSETKDILKADFLGFYLHGSLAMGGFNPYGSDIDILIVTKQSLSIDTKRKLAKLYLGRSCHPFPAEVSILNIDDLKNWQHPCPYEFHYSEFWRERFEKELATGTYDYLNGEVKTDSDLAAHLTIINHRGICIEGESIPKVFPSIPRPHYIASIRLDFDECLENILKEPVYCTLNLIRVFWYLKDGTISSKQEAGEWGLSSLPKEMTPTIQKVINMYADRKANYHFDVKELLAIRNYIAGKVNDLLTTII